MLIFQGRWLEIQHRGSDVSWKPRVKRKAGRPEAERGLNSKDDLAAEAA